MKEVNSMKLNNIHDFKSIDEYVKYKISVYEGKEKNFESLFEMMFDESNNVMIETTDGYRINRVTYGEFKERILFTVPAVVEAFCQVPEGSMVGLYMTNKPEWLLAFWAILAAGYRPLLMNTRLPDDVLDRILKEYDVKAVLSDSVSFPSAKTVMWDGLPETDDRKANPRSFGDEVLFMSSGTTGHVKLCAYTGENFYYQILDSSDIITVCPDIARHYEGELKQLVLLPLCHVFGFIAVYLWFGFFSRTFVFPKDLDPATIQRTVKKHKVTHIFAVPMVWEAVYRAARAKIRARGDKTYKKFLKTLTLVNRLDSFGGDFLARKLLHEVRDGIFGDSIMFLISGGSHIESSVLEFFNGIGYHIANGYGMTEIGITSVERASRKKLLNLGSIGAPFRCTEYSIGGDGHLLVRGKTRASRILCNGKETVTRNEEWFNTGDLMRCCGSRYFAEGRSDDLIVCEDGENLNPTLVERSLALPGVEKLCIFKNEDNRPAIVFSIPGCFATERILTLSSVLSKKMTEAKLDRAIVNVYFTGNDLLAPGEFKLSRRNVAKRIRDGELRVFSPSDLKERGEAVFEGLEKDIADLFAEVLCKDVAEIDRNSHFFRDLGGTSIDYYALLGLIRERLGAQIEVGNATDLATVADFYAKLTK